MHKKIRPLFGLAVARVHGTSSPTHFAIAPPTANSTRDRALHFSYLVAILQMRIVSTVDRIYSVTMNMN